MPKIKAEMDRRPLLKETECKMARHQVSDAALRRQHHDSVKSACGIQGLFAERDCGVRLREVTTVDDPDDLVSSVTGCVLQ